MLSTREQSHSQLILQAIRDAEKKDGNDKHPNQFFIKACIDVNNDDSLLVSWKFPSNLAGLSGRYQVYVREEGPFDTKGPRNNDWEPAFAITSKRKIRVFPILANYVYTFRVEPLFKNDKERRKRKCGQILVSPSYRLLQATGADGTKTRWLRDCREEEYGVNSEITVGEGQETGEESDETEEYNLEGFTDLRKNENGDWEAWTYFEGCAPDWNLVSCFDQQYYVITLRLLLKALFKRGKTIENEEVLKHLIDNGIDDKEMDRLKKEVKSPADFPKTDEEKEEEEEYERTYTKFENSYEVKWLLDIRVGGKNPQNIHLYAVWTGKYKPGWTREEGHGMRDDAHNRVGLALLLDTIKRHDPHREFPELILNYIKDCGLEHLLNEPLAEPMENASEFEAAWLKYEEKKKKNQEKNEKWKKTDENQKERPQKRQACHQRCEAPSKRAK